MNLTRMLAPGLAVMALSLACEPEPDPDPCAAEGEAVVTLGSGVGGEFEPLGPEQEVSLETAPQGGFGVATVIRTTGMRAGEDATANAVLIVEIDGEEAGYFELQNAPLQCTDGLGGQIFGQVVGLDPDQYSTNDDLLVLDGKVVDLVVTVTTDEAEATVRQPVTLVAG